MHSSSSLKSCQRTTLGWPTEDSPGKNGRAVGESGGERPSTFGTGRGMGIGRAVGVEECVDEGEAFTGGVLVTDERCVGAGGGVPSSERWAAALGVGAWGEDSSDGACTVREVDVGDGVPVDKGKEAPEPPRRGVGGAPPRTDEESKGLISAPLCSNQNRKASGALVCVFTPF